MLRSVDIQPVFKGKCTRKMFDEGLKRIFATERQSVNTDNVTSADLAGSPVTNWSVRLTLIDGGQGTPGVTGSSMIESLMPPDLLALGSLC